MQEIKQAAAAVNKKREELESARVELRQAEADAKLPRSAQTRVERVPVPLNGQGGPVRITSAHESGAGTYLLEERVEQPAVDDTLEALRQQRQAEVGQAYIEKRAPEVEDLDREIEEIEGARAALSVLREQTATLSRELEHLEQSLGFGCMGYAREQWDAAYSDYEHALDAMVSALGKMSAADVVAARFARMAGKTWGDRTAQYFDGPRRIRGNGNSYRVDFRDEVIPDKHTRAVALLHGELEQLGVEI